MLGRRLLLLAAVLFATGAIAAALTPRDLREAQPTTTAAPPPPTAPGRSGGTAPVERTVNASSGETAVVRVRVGDLLRLTVLAPSPDEVELEGLGRFQAVDEFSPARFEFFLERAGTFPIRLRESRREIGKLVVEGG